MAAGARKAKAGGPEGSFPRLSGNAAQCGDLMAKPQKMLRFFPWNPGLEGALSDIETRPDRAQTTNGVR
jgi:hypothetical protein